jgi:hypothetical protein
VTLTDPVQSMYVNPAIEMTISTYGHNPTIIFENDTPKAYPIAHDSCSPN